MKEINYPANSQLLFFPMMSGTISAGFKNKKYQDAYKYTHYGIDCDSRYGEDFDVVASATGTVIGVEKNLKNSLGCICVIQYNNVYNPTTKKIFNCVIRYYHMASLYVKKGDSVQAYQPIGRVINHKWWNHIHFELDTDIKHPFYTPQVAESSSVLLVRKGATATTILNPLTVLVVGNKQTMMVHNLAIYADKVLDAPKYSEGIKTSVVDTPKKKEHFPYLPINDCKVTCGYKNPAYLKTYKMEHYGCDMVSASNNRAIYASDDGEVVASGWDGVGPESAPNGAQSGCGYVLVICYPEMYMKPKAKNCGATFTYLHLREKPKVQKGEKVSQGQLLGYYGGTGLYVNGDHLHLQIDYDITYPLACMGMASSGHAILKHGTVDSTVNPLDILYIGEKQSVVGGKYPAQYNASDLKKLEKI